MDSSVIKLPPLALYVHVPFCRRKCGYCDFASVATLKLPEVAYEQGVVREIGLWRAELGDDHRPLHTIFFGGGTPSLLSPDAVGRILGAMRGAWDLSPEVEITLEANPDSLTEAKLAGYRQAGVNRLSLGVQSLRDSNLRWLGRLHDGAAVAAAIQGIRAVGDLRWSLDLIYGLPGQEVTAWLDELAQVLEEQPGHLSCYQLTMEPGVPLERQQAREGWSLPDEESQRAFLLTTRRLLADAGWPAYEISNFAQPGQECRHSRNYWEFGDYLGIGPAAHGKLTTARGIRRTVNPTELATYGVRIAAGRLADAQALTAWEAADECLIMGLRQSMGMDLGLYAALAGQELGTSRPAPLDDLVAAGLIVVTPGRVRLTETGVPVANLVMAALLTG